MQYLRFHGDIMVAKKNGSSGIPKLSPQRPKGVTLSDVHRQWQKDQAKLNPKRIQKLKRKRDKVTKTDRDRLKGENKPKRTGFSRFFKGGGGGSDSPGQPGLKHGKTRREPKLQ